jgi:hypothetical protein
MKTRRLVGPSQLVSANKSSDRPGFREWVDRHEVPTGWRLLPLTHITRGLVAGDIMRTGRVDPGDPCEPHGRSYAFFFYGRPAYRVADSSVIKLEASCPHCFIFRERLIERSNQIYAFDTGAFGARLYRHVLDDDFNAEDFRIGGDFSRPNRLINAAFGSQEDYFEGDRSKIVEPSAGAEPHEMEARSYLELIKSPGRNEPDDRICSIEVVFADPVPLAGELLAVVVPHTLWRCSAPSPLLKTLHESRVEIIPYDFIPGRHPEHYHTLLEAAVRRFYQDLGYLREAQ